ncbi:MAG: DNA gyrase modulator, partial [Bacillota bacterium]
MRHGTDSAAGEGPELKDVPGLRDALDLAVSKGASYADLRVVLRKEESISVKNGTVEGVSMSEDQGFGVRVLV